MTSKRRYHHGDLERALIVTALDIIGSDGVEGLTLRGVGARVGVSRSALYRHFDDKAALVARIASDGFRLLHETLRRVRENAPRDAEDTLEVMAAAHVHFARANPSHYATMFGGVLQGWEIVSRAVRGRPTPRAARSSTRFATRSGAGGLVQAIRYLIAEVMWALTYGVARLGTSSQLTEQRLPIEALAVQGVRWVSDGCQTPI